MYLYTNLPVNAIVRLPHPWSGDSQGQEMGFKHTTMTKSGQTTTMNHYEH